MMGDNDVLGFFVYGTLKRGQCRERCWPRSPLTIHIAWTAGTLFSRRDYPAMTVGPDAVLGELWRFDPHDMVEVARVLDEVEETNQPGLEDLYHRVVVPVRSPEGEPLGQAFTYLYAKDPRLDGFIPMSPGRDEHFVKWTA